MQDKDIFGGINVTVSGIHEEDEMSRTILYDEIARTLKKLGKMLGLNSFVMHVRKYHETGDRAKYSIQAKLLTTGGDFFSDDFAWDLSKAAKGVLEKLEHEVIRQSEREKVHGRGP